jgi:hypothetical protein
MGYIMGIAVTHLPGASDLVLAPLYGAMLGTAWGIVGPAVMHVMEVSWAAPSGPTLPLLQGDGVQKELGLTDGQKEKATEVTR